MRGNHPPQLPPLGTRSGGWLDFEPEREQDGEVRARPEAVSGSDSISASLLGDRRGQLFLGRHFESEFFSSKPLV